MLLAVVSIMSCSSDNNATTILENNTFSEVWKLKGVTLETSSNNALLDDILKEHFAELIDKDEAWYLGFEEQKHYTLIHQKAGKIQVLSKGNFLYHDPVPPLCVYHKKHGEGTDYFKEFDFVICNDLLEDSENLFSFAVELVNHEIDINTKLKDILKQIQTKHKSLPEVENLDNLKVMEAWNLFKFEKVQ